jgi:hypothetical protein
MHLKDKTTKEIVELWERGLLARGEFVWRLVTTVKPEELDDLAPEHLTFIEEYLERYPEEKQDLVMFRVESVIIRTEEGRKEYEKQKSEEQVYWSERIWDSVQKLRPHF